MSSAILMSAQGIGDTLMALFSLFGSAEDASRFDLLASDRGPHLLAALLDLPEGRLFRWREAWPAALNLLWLGPQLRRRGYAEGMVSYPAFRRERALSWLSGIPRVKLVSSARRLPRRPWEGSYSEIIQIGERVHYIDAMARLFRGPFDAGRARARLRARVEALAGGFRRTLWRERGLEGAFVVGVHPGTRGTGKQWPAAGFRELLGLLREAAGPRTRVLVFGGRDEASLRDGLASELGPWAVPVRGAALLESAAAAAACGLFIANDSAPMHLAALQGVPTAAVWGRSNPYQTGPYGRDCAVLLAGSRAPEDLPAAAVFRALAPMIAAARARPAGGEGPLAWEPGPSLEEERLPWGARLLTVA